ncbi:right-handed parallel beta-helix repeat-containing protein [Candidatus Microgenomates bacterium]|nr:right-handed parallel beta-helix repeat-containing protein [Candidatus Microgenomates bacterium]
MKKYFTLLIIASFILLMPKKAWATDYYVATNGNDVNCTGKSSSAYPGSGTSQVCAFRTIQKGADSAKTPGDTVYIRGGIYKEQVTVKYSGAAGNYITFSAYADENVVIDDTLLTAQIGNYGMFNILNKSFIKVSKLQLINSPPIIYCSNGITCDDPNVHSPHTGIFVYNSNNIIVNQNTTQETYSSGIGVWLSENVTIDGNTVINATNDHVPGLDWQSDQEMITIANTANFEVKNNFVMFTGRPDNHGKEYFGRVGTLSIDAKQGSSYGSIHHNKVAYNEHTAGIYIDSYGPTKNIDVYANQLFNVQGGISIGAEDPGYATENVNIYNNVISHNTWAGIIINNSCALRQNISIFNNTIYGANRGGIYIQTRSEPDRCSTSNPNVNNIFIRNNLVAAGPVVDKLDPKDSRTCYNADTPYTQRYDCPWVGQICTGVNATLPGTVYADHNLIIDVSINSYIAYLPEAIKEISVNNTITKEDPLFVGGPHGNSLSNYNPDFVLDRNPAFYCSGCVLPATNFNEYYRNNQIMAQNIKQAIDTITQRFQLKPDSPAIDKGVGAITANINAPATDFNNISRPLDGPDTNATSEYDLGAFEYQTSCPLALSGDFNCDNLINESDLNTLLGKWMTNVNDITGDGKVNESDLNKLLGKWKTI